MNCISVLVHKSDSYKCDQCSKSYKTKTNLNRHIRYECNKERQFVCNYCSKKFTQKSSLEYHIQRKHTKTFVHNMT